MALTFVLGWSSVHAMHILTMIGTWRIHEGQEGQKYMLHADDIAGQVDGRQDGRCELPSLACLLTKTPVRHPDQTEE